jgi:(p)ppGpp synthase/HD superfamily hydrolase
MPTTLDRAILAAAEWHAGQYRDGDNPLPYITHPIEVLSALRNVGGVTDPDALCAAVLHDVLEETSVTPDQIEDLVGRHARDLVVALTREEPGAEETKGMSKEEIWRLRSHMLLTEIEKMPAEVQVIKLADRLSNVREAKHAKKGDKFARYRRQTAEILKIIPRKVNPGLWDAIKAEL